MTTQDNNVQSNVQKQDNNVNANVVNAIEVGAFEIPSGLAVKETVASLLSLEHGTMSLVKLCNKEGEYSEAIAKVQQLVTDCGRAYFNSIVDTAKREASFLTAKGEQKKPLQQLQLVANNMAELFEAGKFSTLESVKAAFLKQWKQVDEDREQQAILEQANLLRQSMSALGMPITQEQALKIARAQREKTALVAEDKSDTAKKNSEESAQLDGGTTSEESTENVTSE